MLLAARKMSSWSDDNLRASSESPMSRREMLPRKLEGQISGSLGRLMFIAGLKATLRSRISSPGKIVA